MSDQTAVSAETKTVDLMPFCDPDPESRYALQKPWRDGDHVVATDGRIFAACDPKLYAGDLAIVTWKMPKWQDIVKPFESVTEWSALPEYIDCGKCNGTGTVYRDCETCDGDGTHECNCGHAHQCGWCDGSGRNAEQCDCEVKFGNRRIARHLANKLLPLPQTEWGVASHKPDQPVFFRFAGGFGVVMPLHGE